jgi:hypothetical protein
MCIVELHTHTHTRRMGERQRRYEALCTRNWVSMRVHVHLRKCVGLSGPQVHSVTSPLFRALGWIPQCHLTPFSVEHQTLLFCVRHIYSFMFLIQKEHFLSFCLSVLYKYDFWLLRNDWLQMSTVKPEPGARLPLGKPTPHVLPSDPGSAQQGAN